MPEPGVINEEPPDDNEAFESLDESLDDADARGMGPEGGRDLDGDLVVDRAELEEVGADLDDPDKDALLLDGAMDDPDVADPDDEWDGEDVADENVVEGGTAGEVIDTAAPLAEDDRIGVVDLERIADDAPGPDSARW